MSEFNILYYDPLPVDQKDWWQDLAQKHGIKFHAPTTVSADELERYLIEAQGLIVHQRPLMESDVSKAPKLRVVQMYGGLPNKLPVERLKNQGINAALMTLPGSVAVAEHAVALILACAKKIVPAHKLTATGAYRDLGLTPKITSQRFHSFQWMKMEGLEELTGLTLGIFGYGDIGNEIAKRMRAFDMKIIYHKRSRFEEKLEHDLNIKYVKKSELFARADVIVMSSPLTPETEKAVGEDELRTMKSTAYLINICRGGVIDETALVNAIKEKGIAGAGLDVFVEEPIPFDHPYLGLENVVLTPHIAAGKGGARLRQAQAVLENIRRYINGEELHQRIT